MRTAEEWSAILTETQDKHDALLKELEISKHFEAIYNELADRLRDRDEIIEKLHELLKKNNIEVEIE